MSIIKITLTAAFGLGLVTAATAQGVPAPGLVRVASETGQGAMTMAPGGTYRLGALEIAAPFARATLPNQPVAGGFLTITNTGDSDDRLVGARSAAAGRMEVHEMVLQGDVMRMREIEGGLPIPAGATVALQPGGYHVMFMDLAAPFEAGQSVEVTLTFEKAGDVTLTMPVVARGGAGMGHGGMTHGGN